MTLPLVALDIECYKNYFLVMFRNVATGNMRSFELYDGTKLDTATIKQILTSYTIITFNGRNYDFPLLMLALKNATNEQLKTASDSIIVGGIKPWDFERQFGVTVAPPSVDHIDIFEVAPGLLKSSLKIYGGRLHCKRMQDLPIDPSSLISPEQREQLKIYCGNDLETTLQLYDYLKPQIELREKMSKQYGQDLRSKSDAQIAEAVIVSQLKKLYDKDIFRPSVPPGTTFRYTPPPWVRFETKALQDVLDLILGTTFMVGKKGSVELPSNLANLKIAIGQGVYRIGIGGLHSSEESVSHLADDAHAILDADCTSFYPMIIINNKFFPQHIGSEFLVVYKGIVDQRVRAKHAGDKITADALKITVNGSYGKFGSKWSKLYSPDLLIQTTLTGQLALLMLIERLEGTGKQVLSANTDGITFRTLRGSVESCKEGTIRRWEQDTGFNIEYTEYKSIHNRDVNSYIAVKKDGSVKTKGAFAPPGLSKNPANEICTEAVIAFIKESVPVAETIKNCQDIRKFVTIRQVKGGAVKDEKYLGKAVRWYYARGETGVIRYKENGNTVARSEGAKPCMELPDTFPDDIDHTWYIRESNDILQKIGYYKTLL